MEITSYSSDQQAMPDDSVTWEEPTNSPVPDIIHPPDIPNNVIEQQAPITVSELKGYIRGISDILGQDQGLSPEMTRSLFSKIMSLPDEFAKQSTVFTPKPNEVEQPNELPIHDARALEGTVLPNGRHALEQDNNPFNRRQQNHPSLIPVNPPKRPLKQADLNNPAVLRNMRDFETKWEMSQRGLPDAGGVAEKTKYPY